MPDTVRVGAGTLLKMGDTTATTFASIAEVRTIGELEEARAEIDATPLNATARRYIGGIKDGAQIEVGMYLLTDNATQGSSTGVYSVFKNNQERQFIIAPKGLAFQYRFSAIVLRHRMGLGSNSDANMRTVSLRITSDVVEETNTNT
jgi:hypothetical protein